MSTRGQESGTIATRAWKNELESAVKREDAAALREIAGRRLSATLRFLQGRLYSADRDAKSKTLLALGTLAAAPSLLDGERATELLRRFVWALNDESGAVPYGVPEAIGEVLAVRPELRSAFLPILCALVTEEEMSQTGPIEEGALWALGRIGPPVRHYSEAVVSAVRHAAESHPSETTRRVAAASLESILRGANE